MTIRLSMSSSVLLFILLVVPTSAEVFDDTVKEFDTTLVGEWVVRSSDLAGKKGKASQLTTRVHITKDRVRLIDAGKTELELDCRLNESKSPKEIDLTFELDKGTGPIKMSVKGIFKIVDGRITLCFNGDPNGERPKEFKKATEENGLMVFELVTAPTPK